MCASDIRAEIDEEAKMLRSKFQRYVPDEPIGDIAVAALLLGATMVLSIILIRALGN